MPPEVSVVALVADLMDRSRISASLGDVASAGITFTGITFTGDPGACSGADVVIVDLARHATAVPAVRAAAPEARIVAFGPHVDDELLAHARRDGADVVLPRSRFFRDPAAALTVEN